MRRSTDSGQAAVETAITMPLALFMVLGTLQLFMLMQGRLFAEHAAWAATRVGSVRHGDCKAMTHAAMLALLPSFTSYLGNATPGSGPAQKLAQAFKLRTDGKPHSNQYDPVVDAPHHRPVFWIYRLSPRLGQVRRESEEDFDDPDTGGYRLEVHLVYWYPLRIPFANWVMATLFRAYFGFGDYSHQNPLVPTQRANWSTANRSLQGFKAEFLQRYADEEYVFPVSGTAVLRMMTPPRPSTFRTQHCDPTP